MDEYVLITGASSGIGKALSYAFAEHGENLILVARRLDTLQVVAEDLIGKYHVKITVLSADLTEEASAGEIHDFCVRNDLTVKTLVNNAGMGAQGNFVDLSLDTQEKILSLNAAAVVRMCRIFLPDMKNRRSGTVVNIASTTAFMPLANEAVYAASKAFILSFSQALYEEMKPFGVTICTICPGVTNTDFFKTAAFSLENFKGADPADFAAYAYRRIVKKKPLSIHRFSNCAIAVWARLFPRGAVRRISAKFG